MFEFRKACVRAGRLPLDSDPMKGTLQMSTENDHSGLTALAICEALLLAMNDHGRITEVSSAASIVIASVICAAGWPSGPSGAF
jgi:hypothetical protein